MKDVVPFYVRVPAAMKEQLDVAARKNFRSVNAELVARINESFNPSAKSLTQYESGDLVGELMRRYPPGEIFIRIGIDKPE